MDELLITLGLVFQLSGPPLPIQCRFLAVVMTPNGPRLGMYCEASLPEKTPDEEIIPDIPDYFNS